jgi:hypothetical protein
MNEHLDVAYHQQDTDYYCGAACAQMVLRSIGLPLLLQDDLYADNHAHSVEPIYWSTPPDGLCWTLNNRQGAKHFSLDATDTEDPISRTICWSIHQYQCAPVALVFGGNHWLVVRGYTASAAPANVGDSSYTITSFDLNNPWPPVPAPPGPPPHADGDVCGSGGARGVPDINVSYSGWQSGYLTANGFGNQWLNKFVAVCDADPAGGPIVSPGSPIQPTSGGGQAAGGNPLTASDVRQRLPNALRRGGLLTHPLWSARLGGASAGQPLLVQRLDQANSDYWLVPTLNSNGELRAMVGIDARSGDYHQALAIRDANATILAYADVQAAAAQARAQSASMPADMRALLSQPGALTVPAPLVWRPCRESLSPFYPFRMITTGASTVYVRIFDGAVFAALTTNLGGL